MFWLIIASYNPSTKAEITKTSFERTSTSYSVSVVSSRIRVLCAKRHVHVQLFCAPGESIRLWVVHSDVVIHDDQQEERHSEHIGEDCQLHVSNHLEDAQKSQSINFKRWVQ